MTTPVVNKTHDLVITRGSTTTGFMLGRWQVARANDFTARIGSGKLTHSDLDVWQSADIEDWSHGLGFEKYKDDMAVFLTADAELETAVEGQITLASKWVSSDADFVANKFQDFGNYLFAGGGVLSGGHASVRKYDPTAGGGVGTWANSKTDCDAVILDMKQCFGKLYVALGDAVDMESCTAAATDTWATVTGHKARCLEVWKTLLWCGNAGNVVSFDGNATWTTKAIGDSSSNVTALSAQDTYLLIFKDDGRVYTYDGTTVLDLMRFPAYNQNFRQSIDAFGWLHFGMLSAVERISGLSSSPALQKITPKYVGEDTYGWGNPVAWTDSQNYVYCLFDKGGSTNNIPGLLKYNQQGWHVVYIGAAGATAYTCYYSRVSGRLWVNDGASRYQRLVTLNDSPYPDYDTTAGKTLYLAHHTAGMDDIVKIYKEIEVVSENLTSDIKITFYYQDDRDGAWTEMGAATTSPVCRIAFATGTAVAAKDMYIKAVLQTNDADVTPKLKGVYVYYLARPATSYAIQCELIVEDDIELKDGTGKDTNTVAQLLTELRTISDTALPVTLDGPDDLQYRVVETNIGWTMVDAPQEKRA